MKTSLSTPDNRTRTYICPCRVVWQQNAKDAEQLLSPRSGQSTGWGKPGTVLPFGSSLLLDFGKELHGGVQIISGHTGKGPKKLKIRLRFGESVSEAMADPNNDHSIHDAELDLPVMGWLEYGCTGFRFVRVDMLTTDAELEIKELRAVSLMRDLEWLGSFECSDKRLNEIWRTGAYTTQLCMQDYIWDGIKRDRLVWMGDMHPEIMVVSTVFGRQEVVERSLDLVRDETPMPQHMNGISSYSLWWLIAQRDWFLLHGATDYLKTQREYIEKLLHLMMESMVEADGVECMPGFRFLDWPSNDDDKAKHAGLQSLLVLAFDAGAELCKILDEKALAEKCLDIATLMRSKVPSSVPSKQASALMALAGLQDAKETNAGILAKDPFHGVSTFYGYYVLQARAKAGDYQGCLDLIRNYWGGMLDLGATTFWEHFELDWRENASRIDELPQPGKHDVHREYGAYCFKSYRHSLCHGWASGPTAWLSEHVLGVKVLKPGASLVAIEPHLGDLEWARGSFPTPYGSIEVEHRRGAKGSVESKVKAPAGIKIMGNPN